MASLLNPVDVFDSASYEARCGCIAKIHKPTGAKFSTNKCQHHLDVALDNKEGSKAYYDSISSFSLADLVEYHKEFFEGFGSVQSVDSGRALEIGGGLSPYPLILQEAGYSYVGIDPSEYACEQMRNKGFESVCSKWEDYNPALLFNLILCCHSLEHMRTAIDSLQKMYDSLLTGGLLYLLIPDDKDLTNPDHYWFFNQQSITKALHLCGFTIERVTLKDVVPHEGFIYIVARKK